MIPGLRYQPALNGAGSSGSGGGGGGLSFTLIGSATSTSTTISVPAAAIAGDWAILFDTASNKTGSSVSTAVPSGWTSLADGFVSSGRSIRSTVSHRKLTGGGTVTGMTGDLKSKVMLVFRPSTSILTTVPSTWNNEATAGDPSSQTVTASGVTTPLIVFAVAAATSSSAPSFSTETPAMTNITTAQNPLAMRIGYTIYNSSPSNQSIDMGDSSVNVLQSGYVRFT